MKAKEWDMVHEGNDPVKRRRFERMKQRFAVQFTDLMSFTDGGNRLLKAMQKFLELAEEHAVEVETD